MIWSNAFRYFAVAGFINALVLSILLLTNRRNHLAKLYMIALVLTTTFQTILNAFDAREFFLLNPHLSKISWLIPSLFGPLVYLFTKKLCSDPPVFKKSDLIHALPFVAYLILLLPWFLKSAVEKRSYLDNFEKASIDDFGFLNQFSILLILGYLLMTLRFLRGFRKNIEETFSELSQKRIEWMSLFAYGVLIVLFISALGFYGSKWNIPGIDAIYHYNYIPIVLLVYWIAYKALLQPVIFEIPLKVDNQQESISEKYVRSGMNDEKAELLYHQLVGYMKNHKPYLDPELNIYQLAQLLGMKKHHLSQVINDKAGMNFFDFINSFRVEETKKNLSEKNGRNLTLLAIALDSGFNSKATFNTAFKKFTGLTPSDFEKKVKIQV
jgi:AraC-like DNA-binding protein